MLVSLGNVGRLGVDLRLYARLVAMQVRAQAQYKASLAIDIGTFLAVTSLEFCVVLIQFGKFPTLLGWRVGEVALLYGLVSFSLGVAEMVGAGIDGFQDTIRRGEFDRVLLRPVGPLAQVAGSDFRLRRLGRIVQGALSCAVALHLLPHLHWTVVKALMLLLGVASGALVFTAVFLLGATMCFWTVETSELVNIAIFGGRELLSYPLPIYNQVFQRLFVFVIPLAFGSYIPVCYVLGRSLPFGLPSGVTFAAPLVSLAFALVAAAVWRVGIRHYQSTGS